QLSSTWIWLDVLPQSRPVMEEPPRGVSVISSWGSASLAETLMKPTDLQVERRAAQRFEVNLPLCVRRQGSDLQGTGFTQNLCARGTLFYTSLPLSEGETVEATLVMPSQITLGEDMPVRCLGTVLRVLSSGVETQFLVAVHVQNYEYLPDSSNAGNESRRLF